MTEKTVEHLSVCLMLRVLSVEIVKLYVMVIVCVLLMVLCYGGAFDTLV